jgi:hypothetical protein
MTVSINGGCCAGLARTKPIGKMKHLVDFGQLWNRQLSLIACYNVRDRRPVVAWDLNVRVRAIGLWFHRR